MYLDSLDPIQRLIENLNFGKMDERDGDKKKEWGFTNL